MATTRTDPGRRSFLARAAVLLAGACAVAAQPLPDRVWIYRKKLPVGAQPTSAAEAYFSPFFIFPESATDRVRVNPSKPAADFGPVDEADDTCVEFYFGLAGGDDFVGAGFIPGDKLGAEPAFDLTQHLSVGFGRQVHLKFRARTADGERVRVRFESCGLAAGKLEDGIKLPQTPRPQVTALDDKWQTVSIDLSQKAAGLVSLACPLKVIVRSSDNPNTEEAAVFVDDVRFEIVPKGKAGQ